MGERLNGIQEVVGSIPSGSTKIKGLAEKSARPFLFSGSHRVRSQAKFTVPFGNVNRGFD
ncbi:hypothetical protein PHAMO_400019 [Magnetospirillum molischianum DSM 120]|uniref:Uncharacterized protein n=1 Tax=Magnetospirillum molischianum DSM 120 TaxID=1150626 RepID=H8FWA0_MAGML|nr:hypothetical protein PHAMO_400019 [Magnetospirillum molischianum DSM 120]